MAETLNTSWLHGKYPEIDAEINTLLSYVAIGEFYAQGDDADRVINEIHAIWLNSDTTQSQAIEAWRNMYL